MTADRSTLASAMTAPGSEVALDLLLGHALALSVLSDEIAQPAVHLAAHLVRQVGRGPGDEEPGRQAVTGNEHHVVRPQQFGGVVAEVADRDNPHLVTTSVTIMPQPGLLLSRRA